MFRHIHIITFLFLCANLTFAQTSVYTNIRVSPPYSVYLQDYVEPGKAKIQVSLRLDDQVEATRDVKLRFSIKGDNITLVTKPEFAQKLTLSAGVQETFQGDDDDIAPYFTRDKWNFQGSPKQETDFRNTGRLPEGYYQFSVEVLDFQRNTVLSNLQVFAFAWIQLSSPPCFRFPVFNCGNNTVVETKINAFANPVFNIEWESNNAGARNSAFTTEYDLKIVELWPNENQNPIDALNSSPNVFYEEKGMTTRQVVYDQSKPMMTPGRKFVVRLRAYDAGGLDLFRDNGYAVPIIIQYGDVCQTPTLITARAPNWQQGKITWQAMPSNSAYTIRYRERGQTDWYYQNDILFTEHTISNLYDNRTYEYQVIASCGQIESAPSAIASFATPAKPATTFNCGQGAAAPAATNTSLLTSIAVGERFTARGYDIEVTEITASNSKFTGKGIMAMPFLNNARMQVEFTDIAINSERKLSDGRVRVTQGAVTVLNDQQKQKLLPIAQTVDNVYDKANKLADEADTYANQVTDFMTTAQNLPQQAKELIQQGSQQIKEGKAMIAQGNITSGQNLIEQGKKAIQEGINKAGSAAKNSGSGVGGVVGALAGGVTNFKDLLINVFRTTSDSLQAENEKIGNLTLYEKIDAYNGFATDTTVSTVSTTDVYETENEEITIEALKTENGFSDIITTYQKEKKSIALKMYLQQNIKLLAEIIANEPKIEAVIASIKRDITQIDFTKIDYANLGKTNLETTIKNYIVSKILE